MQTFFFKVNKHEKTHSQKAPKHNTHKKTLTKTLKHFDNFVNNYIIPLIFIFIFYTSELILVSLSLNKFILGSIMAASHWKLTVCLKVFDITTKPQGKSYFNYKIDLLLFKIQTAALFFWSTWISVSTN